MASSTSPSGGVFKPNYPRVTVNLTSYSEVDIDHDGQIGLYEWTKAKKPKAEFNRMDLNHDGFLTPLEIKMAGTAAAATTMVASSATPATTPGTPTGTPVASGSSATVMASTSTSSSSASPPVTVTMSPEEQAKIDQAAAKNIFELLDRNSDGKISEEEMARSARTKPMFESAGYSFKEPMSSDKFIPTYLELKKKASGS